MKGCNPSRILQQVHVWGGVLLLGLMPGQLEAAPSSHAGQQGESLKRAEINLSDLAAQPAGPQSERSGRRGRPRPATRRNDKSAWRGRPQLPDSELKAVAASDGPVDTLSFTAAGGPGASSPPPSASFQALPDNETAYNPDTHGAVGPNHLMATLASQVRVQSRLGSNLLTMSLNTFWGAVGNSNVYDPRVLYDAAAQRWITTAIADPPGSNSASLLIGVSATSDPTGFWHLRSVPVDALSNIYAESPNVGFTKDWITIAVPLFTEANSEFFSSDIWVFNKTNLYAGGSGQFTYFRYANPFIGGDSALVPAVTLDSTFSTNFLVANWSGSDGLGNGFLRLFSISGPVNAPVFEDYEPEVTYTNGLFAGLTASWDSYPPVDNFAPQLGTSSRIFIGDARIQNVVFRNATLWCTHHVFLPANAPTRSSIQWFSMTPGGNITQTGRIDDGSGGKFYAYPSLAVNANEDVMIGFSRFGASQYPSANYSFASSENLILRPDAVLKAGENSFTLQDPVFGLIRWGDWSATVVDPLNDTDFWTIQEYAGSPGNDHWGTWWGRVAPPTDLTLAVTGSPGTVLAGGNVTYSLRVTNNALTVATGVTISNALPAGAQFVSAVPSVGACFHNAGVVTCTFGDLSGEFDVSATIVATLTQSGSATNTAVVFGFGPEEGLAADNTVKTVTAVNTSSDVSLLMTASPNPVTVSNNLTFLVVVTNRGPSIATGVTLTNTLPPGVTFVSAAPGQAGQGTCSQTGGGVSCNLGTLVNNGAVNVSIVVRPNGPGPLTNRASVVTAVLAQDPNLLNNTNSVSVRANAAPTMQGISPRSILEDGVLVVSFTVSDFETLATNLQVVAFSSNQAIVPDSNIRIDNADSSRVMTITPFPNAFGSNFITRIVTDADGASTTNGFTLLVQEDNDRPTVSLITNVTNNEDTVVGPIPFTIGDAETPGSLTVFGSSSNPQLIPNASIDISPTGLSRTVRLTPLANSNGTANITLTVSDGALSTNRVFTVVVNSVNDLPTISDIASRTNNEDTATGLISFIVGDVETAPGSLVLGRLSSNQTLVPTNNIEFGGSGSNRNVTITPAPNEFGTAVITVSVTDGNGGSTNDTFQITVNQVNDPPTLDPIIPNPLNILEDAGLQVVTLNNITVGAANEPQTNRITATSSNPGLILNLTTNYAPPASTGTLTFTPAANATGSVVITVTVDDGGASNSVLVRTLSVNVMAVNDPPTISDITNRVTTEDVATGASPFTVGDIDSPLASLSFVGRCSDPNLVPSGNFQFNSGGSGSNWTVNITPAPNKFGTATNFIFVSDGSATNSTAFLLTVLPVNDVPTIAAPRELTIAEDAVTDINFTIGDAETAAGSLNLTAISSNPALLPSVTFGGSGGDRTVHVVPVANQFGFVRITISVSDGDGGTNTAIIDLTVSDVNDLPTIGFIDNITLDEDAGQQTVSLTGIGSGAPNENQALAVTASSGNPGLVSNLQVTYASAQPVGTLRFTPVPNSNGLATITVFVSDGQATNSRTFNVTVRSINDPPSISDLPDLEIDEDVTTNIVFTVGDIETPLAQLLVQASSSNPELVDDQTGITIRDNGGTRTLVLTPSPEESGFSVITVTVTDGSNEVATTDFELTVKSVNDLPTISGLTNVTIPIGATNPVLRFLVSDAETIPSQLILSKFSSNPSLVPTNNLIFDTGTGVNRTLTVRPLAGQDGSTTIRITVADANGGRATNSFVFSVVAPTNDPPVISNITDTNVNEDLQLTVGFIVGDPDDDAGALELTAASSNLALLPVSRIDFGGFGPNRLVTLMPMANQTGSVTVTITATDSYGASASDSFVLAVNPINDPPTLSGLPGITISEDTATGPLTVVVGDVDTPLANLSLSGTSGNIALVPNANISVVGAGSSRTVTITPVANQSGSNLITLTLSDGAGGTTNTTFLLTVLAVNDPPTLNTNADLLGLAEDAGLQTVNLSGISAGGGESQPLVVTATSSNLLLISTINVNYTPGSSTGTLTFTPLPNATGTTLITVKVDDGQPQNGVVLRTFRVTVGASNDGPTISDIADQQINEDTILTVPFTIGDPETAGMSLLLSATSTNATLVANTNILFSGAGTNRTLTIIPTPNLFGTNLITVRVTDGVATNSDSFVLRVAAVNDPPTLNPINHFGANQAGSNPTFTIDLAGISTGATNESQVLLVTATSANTALLPNPTVNYTSPNATGTLTLRPGNSANGTSLITVTVNDQGSSNNTLVRTFLVSIKPSANIVPTISVINAQTLSEDTPSAAIPFTVRDAETGAAGVAVHVTSSNPLLLPTNNIAIALAGPGGTNRTITLTPAANLSGTGSITLTATDGNSGSSNMTFNVTVNSSNDGPTISFIANQAIDEDTPTGALTFNVTDVETPAGNLVVTATSGNQTLVPNGNILLGGSGTNRALVITPAPNQNGNATITVNVNDGSVSASNQFTLTVGAINDRPTISDVADQIINEDTATAALAFTVGDVETLAGSLVRTASSSDTNLVPNNAFTFGGSDSNPTVVVMPAPNQFGTATITLSISDGTNQVSDTFVLTVNPTNDPPTLGAIGDRTVLQNAGIQSVSLAGISSGAPNENQSLIVAASSGNPALIPNPSVTYTSPEGSGSLSFQPVAGASGNAVITVVVNDGQAQNNLATRTFNVTVTAAPVIAAVPNQVISEDRIGSQINFTVTDADSPLSLVTVGAISSNPTLVPSATLSPGGTEGNRTLIITPTANEYGFATITLSAQDGSGNVGRTDFLVTVAPVNDAPAANRIGDRFLPPNAGLQTISLSGISSGAANEAQALVVAATSGNPALIADPIVNYASPAGTGTLSFTPAANATGVVVITVRVMDDGGTELGGTNQSSQQFTVNIGGVPPQLRILRVGANVVVSWPTNNADGWTLRSGTGLSNPSSWNAVATQPTVVLGRYTVTNSAGGSGRFYRLCSGCSTGMPQDATLTIRRTSGVVMISWSASAGDFALESTPSLSAPVDWAPVGNPPVPAEGQLSVTLDVELTPRFFRLRSR